MGQVGEEKRAGVKDQLQAMIVLDDYATIALAKHCRFDNIGDLKLVDR